MNDGMDQTNVIATPLVTEGSGARGYSALEDFDAVVRNEQQRVYRFLMMMLHDEDAADNLTQDCFVKVFENRGRFRGECSVRTWVLRIASNLVKDHRRNRGAGFWRRLFQWSAEPETIETIVDPAGSPERVVAAREQLATVWSDMESLSDQQRVVFTLRFVEDMSIEQIADTTCLRPGTVKSHLSRAIAAIRARAQERENL